jgi:hypothetical protein
MLGRIVKRNCLIEMRSACPDISRTQQGNAHDAVRYQERSGRSLPLGERQELPRKLAHHVAVERYVVRQPDTVEDREQKQRVLRSLSERFSLFDQKSCPLRSGFFDIRRDSFRRRTVRDQVPRGPKLAPSRVWAHSIYSLIISILPFSYIRLMS